MKARTRTVLIGAVVSLALFATMALIVRGTEPWQGDTSTEADSAQANDVQGVVDSLFGPNVIGFEVLGILLTAIMIGALVIARPLDAQSDSERYSHPTKEQVSESDHVSNVKESLGRTAAANDPMTTRFATEEVRE
ncbi:MAG: NADH-quinone oxidoreductase subunit J family protein [Thermoplasmatota archaeon]